MYLKKNIKYTAKIFKTKVHPCITEKKINIHVECETIINNEIPTFHYSNTFFVFVYIIRYMYTAVIFKHLKII